MLITKYITIVFVMLAEYTILKYTVGLTKYKIVFVFLIKNQTSAINIK